MLELYLHLIVCLFSVNVVEHIWYSRQALLSVSFALIRMSAKVMITYKRKRVTSRAHAEDDTVVGSSSAASSNAIASNLPLKSEGNADNAVINEDNFVRNLALLLLLMLLSDVISISCDCLCYWCLQLPEKCIRLHLIFLGLELVVSCRYLSNMSIAACFHESSLCALKNENSIL